MDTLEVYLYPRQFEVGNQVGQNEHLAAVRVDQGCCLDSVHPYRDQEFFWGPSYGLKDWPPTPALSYNPYRGVLPKMSLLAALPAAVLGSSGPQVCLCQAVFPW